MISKFYRLVLGGIAICLTLAGVDFLTWRSRQIKRLENGSSLLDTARGAIEYTSSGSGPAVLVLHGTLGGYDQIQGFSRWIDSTRYRTILVSRPGYLRTPLSSGVTFEQQADLYAATLDRLGIDRVAVVAFSGGGPSALQFATRYPERCWGLVLIAADTDASQPSASSGYIEIGKDGLIHFLQSVFLSDISSWLIVRASQIAPRQFLRALVGGAFARQVYADPEQRRLFLEMVSSMALLSRRRAGAINDNEQYLASQDTPFEKITTPVLILHGSEDTAVPTSEQVRLHARLPNSSYIEIDSGTHFMPISHPRILIDLLLEFLDAHAPD